MNTIVIVEGHQGAGKTTVTNWLRENMLYSNLYRLTGHSDKTPSGLEKSIKMYDNLMSYIKGLIGCNVNLIFDRIFITEEVYCRLGYRDYSYSSHFDKMLRKLNALTSEFRVVIINLECRDTNILSKRLARDKEGHLDIKFSLKESLAQRCAFYSLMDEITKKCPKVMTYNIGTDREEMWKTALKGILTKELK